MRVTRLGKDCLRIRPVREAMLLLVPGLLFASGSLVLSWFVGQSAALSCERVGAERPRCELRRALLGWPVKTVVIEGLKSARVERHWNTEGDTYEVRLVMTRGEVSLSGSSSSGVEAKARIAEEVNDFLSDPSRPTLTVQQSGLSGAVVGAVFTGLGLLIGFTGLRTLLTTWTFDRVQGVFTHRQGRLFGSRVMSCALGEIAGVTLRDFRDSEGTRIHRIVLRTTSGEELPLTSQYYFWRGHLEETVSAIRKFLAR